MMFYFRKVIVKIKGKVWDNSFEFFILSVFDVNLFKREGKNCLILL